MTSAAHQHDQDSAAGFPLRVHPSRRGVRCPTGEVANGLAFFFRADGRAAGSCNFVNRGVDQTPDVGANNVTARRDGHPSFPVRAGCASTSALRLGLVVGRPARYPIQIQRRAFSSLARVNSAGWRGQSSTRQAVSVPQFMILASGVESRHAGGRSEAVRVLGMDAVADSSGRAMLTQERHMKLLVRIQPCSAGVASGLARNPFRVRRLSVKAATQDQAQRLNQGFCSPCALVGIAGSRRNHFRTFQFLSALPPSIAPSRSSRPFVQQCGTKGKTHASPGQGYVVRSVS